jgi:hypothetical protein
MNLVYLGEHQMKSPSYRRASIGVLASAALVLAGTAASAVGGGTTVGNDTHRYVAKIRGPAGACTGSLVAPLWVVTAKNCVPHTATGAPTGPITLTVGRGDLTGTAGRVQQAPKVVARADRDLALVKLAIPVADLPVLPIATTAPAADATVQVIGYGRTAGTWVPDKATIAPFTVGALGSATFAVTSPNGQDTCKGDAGGPTLAGDRLVGITSTSWQHGCLAVTETRQGGGHRSASTTSRRGSSRPRRCPSVRSPAWRTSASTTPTPGSPTATCCSSTPATAARRRSGQCAPTS